MTKDLLFIIIAMLVAAILGYFIGRRNSSTVSTKTDTSNSGNQNAKIRDLENKLRDCQNQNRQLKSSSSTPAGFASGASTASATASSGVAANQEVSNFDKDAASNALGKRIKADDLKVVEGIGPKIESILKDNNIKTWKGLADSSAEAITEILIRVGGDSYRIHEPTTWPKQARMAFEGKWKELADYQDRLKGGKEV